MANQLYYTIIKISKGPGKGHFELHNSTNKKDLTSGRPDKMAKSIRYYDRESFYMASQVIMDWHHELEDRYGAIEVHPLKSVWLYED